MGGVEVTIAYQLRGRICPCWSTLPLRVRCPWPMRRQPTLCSRRTSWNMADRSGEREGQGLNRADSPLGAVGADVTGGATADAVNVALAVPRALVRTLGTPEGEHSRQEHHTPPPPPRWSHREEKEDEGRELVVASWLLTGPARFLLRT